MQLHYQEEEEYDLRGSRRRTWDDEFVLKRQFSALIPAFDPRPGRTNVNQTQDFEITPPGQRTDPIPNKILSFQKRLLFIIV